ncbi:MFS transporter-like protein 114 [Elsinoe australis]|uniref:MFS transporter-like protein 114 n=1 Tax=Elsinoe australis TaxID=40998 RepID=A0A4V6DTS5_9PEZI|nr:MFS transporter-like protein 114 [Elsinoe australis]
MSGRDAEETSSLLPGTDQEIPPRDAVEQKSAIIAWTVIVIVFLVSVGGQLMDYSSLRILESIICYRTWQNKDPSKLRLVGDEVGPGALGGVSEELCKGNDIQGELATLRGYQQLLDGAPGLVLALPFGYAADRFGRRPLVLLALTGFALQASWIQIVMWFWRSFDVHLVLLSSLSGLFGATSAIFDCLLLAILSDVTKFTQRTTVFLRLGAASYVALLVAPPLASLLMSINPWISGLGGTALMACAPILAALLVPETKQKSVSPPSSRSQIEPRRSTEIDNTMDDGSHAKKPEPQWRARSRRAISFALRDLRVPVLIALFLGHQFIGATGSLLVQYCSKNYNITTAKATLLMSILQGVKAAHCALILPLISSAISRHTKLSGPKRDLYLARASLCLIAFGWSIIGASSSIAGVVSGMVFAALGQGAYYMIRALVTALIPADYIASVFSVISILDTAGYMLGGPVLSGLYRVGLHHGPPWIGLPFLFIGVVGLSFAFVLSLIKME